MILYVFAVEVGSHAVSVEVLCGKVGLCLHAKGEENKYCVKGLYLHHVGVSESSLLRQRFCRHMGACSFFASTLHHHVFLKACASLTTLVLSLNKLHLLLLMKTSWCRHVNSIHQEKIKMHLVVYRYC